jgi:hypothetical protein
MIYFIQAVDGGPIKIGFTDKNIKTRLSIIQVGNPRELQIIGLIDNDVYSEEVLHNQFNKYLIRGEWFEPASEILKFIEDNNSIDKESLSAIHTKRRYGMFKTDDDRYIQDNYGKIPTASITSKIGKSIQQVSLRANKLGIYLQ